MAREKFRRVSKERIRQNAIDSGSRGRYLSLPKDVKEWEPEKATSYDLDFIPYVVTIDNHPDKIEKGELWYKFPFAVHKDVGPNNEKVLCPASFGSACPICEDRKRLADDSYEDNKAEIKALTAQRFVAFSILDPEDSDKVCVFAQSYGKFMEALEEEMKSGKEENVNFYDVNDEGRTLTIRFSEEAYLGRKFLKATRIDFKDRGELDQDEILKKTVCLDDIFQSVLSYDKLKALYLQINESGKSTSKEKDKTSAKSKENDKSDKSDSNDDDRKDSSDFSKGDRVQFEKDGETIVGEITNIDGDDVIVEDDAGDDHDAQLSDLSAADDKKEEKNDKKDNKDKGKKGDKTPEKSPSKGAKFKVGDRVEDDAGDQGKIVDIDKDGDVTFELDSGDTKIAEKDDLILVEDDAGDDNKKDGSDDPDFEVGDWISDGEIDGEVTDIDTKKGEVTIKDVDNRKTRLDLEKCKKSDKPAAFKVNDKVTWDDGNEEGVVVKVKDGKLKVKDDTDTEIWKDIKKDGVKLKKKK